MKSILLDVSDLPAPEPFDQIMQALNDMAKQHYLKVVHRKQPLLLYQPLQKLGFNFHVQKGKNRPYEIYIWPEGQNIPPDLILPNLANTGRSTNKCDGEVQ